MARRLDRGAGGSSGRITPPQLVEEAGAGGGVNGSIDASTPAQGTVRGVGDRVHRLAGDVADGELEAPLPELPGISR